MKLLPLVFVAGLALTSFNLSAKIMANDNRPLRKLAFI